MKGCLWIFGLLWLLGVAAFDWMAFSGVYQQARAGHYTAAQAIVLDSRVVEKQGDDSTSYQPYLKYRFEAGGKIYTGDRYRYGLPGNGRRAAQAMVKAHPIGSTLEVYYAPEDPNQSVVDNQLGGRDAFIIMFLMPFNAIGLGFLIGPLMLQRAGPGGIPVVREGMGWRARLKYTHPLAAAVTSLGCLSFLAIFVIGISSSMNPSLETMRLAWMAVAFMSGWAAFQAAQNNRLGAGDLRIEPGRVEYFSGSQRESRPISEIESVEIKRHEKRDSDGDVTYRYEVELRLHSGEKHPIHEWAGEPPARAFADWLRTHLSLV
ncbi:MAG: DUF3592 domain-containing protein [Candidatus Eremiobacteraeota bacterium]|nr:DUF3592 domain-containing protein [Candidatus Eremiobacteraeota bacterium]MCW5872337.1 DUF3592 domain-containing protein [Candidatus Eremiobacteraeota bacterium]